MSDLFAPSSLYFSFPKKKVPLIKLTAKLTRKIESKKSYIIVKCCR